VLADIDGNPFPLSTFEGKVCLIINVATQWVTADFNYAEMEKLHEKYSQQGLVILAFPCNQFFRQEKGTAMDIKSFVSSKKFTLGSGLQLFDKIRVNGSNAEPLYQFLASHQNTSGFMSDSIKWNFSKFLCNRAGTPILRFETGTTAETMEEEIQKLLQEPYMAYSEFI